MVTSQSTKRGRGQPRKEPTQLVRAYSADVPLLKQHGKTQAQAIRSLIKKAAPGKARNPMRPHELQNNERESNVAYNI